MLIHCDYCGSAFDPEKNASCPSCGAPWATDKEAARVKAEEERRARAEQEKADAERSAATADTIIRTVNAVGGAAGKIAGLVRIVFWVVFGLGLLFFLFVFARIVFHF